jgi:hypothetical protein
MARLARLIVPGFPRDVTAGQSSRAGARAIGETHRQYTGFVKAHARCSIFQRKPVPGLIAT